MKGKSILSDRYFQFLIIIAVIFIGYWSWFGNYEYTHYLDGYYDIGIETYSTYWHLHPMAESLLQYLVFGNHIAPFRVLLLPIFAIYQQPVTLFAIQASALALAALFTYVICIEITKSKKIGAAIAIAFMLNPGVGGLLIFDFHSEAFLPLFYIMAFYFYIKNKKPYFILSYLLLMGVMEESPFLGASLLLGLFVYEVFHGNATEESRARKGLLYYGVVFTLLFAAGYYAAGNYLVSSYSNAAQSSVPPILRYGNFLNHEGGMLSASGSAYYNTTEVYYAGIAGLFVLFLGFGITSLRNPFLSVVLYSPWILQVFMLHDLVAAIFYFQYYAYAVGGSFVSAMLGFMILSKRSESFCHGHHSGFETNETFYSAFIFSMAIMLSLILVSNIFGSALIVIKSGTTNYNIAESALSLIPANSSVMTETAIAAHLFYIKDLELLPSYYDPSPFVPKNRVIYWFKPEYIVVDSNLPNYEDATNSSLFNLNSYTVENYTVYYNRSGVTIFKRKYVAN